MDLNKAQPAMVGEDGLPPGARGWAMLSLAIGVGMASLDTAIANTALPAIASELNTTPAASVWIVNVYQLAMVATLLPFSSLGEIVGYRRVFLSGMLLFTLASLACAMAWSLPSLVVARLFQGVGASAMMSVNTALLREGWEKCMADFLILLAPRSRVRPDRAECRGCRTRCFAAVRSGCSWWFSGRASRNAPRRSVL